ncbi:SRPBCC family protein [Jiangella alkaliphila]|uniref:Polyketide cyclase / dehydrase and lipid transport n=1 Tax=Jiangella alkaliphila TaxID=419479 RepID=A0A1H2JZB1_9ACTN|nr:SRPBCC family protein [Jiangella alkaliphila]SDU61770.1 Polyketide cyclase / dehydrase and lipid transport [Jiangella alkaliphila]
MGVQRIDVTATTTAPAGAVYALLRDGASWPDWSPIGSFELESPGEDGGESLGAMRVFRTGRITSRERIVELVPERRLSYVLVSGLAIKGYRADVDLTEGPDGTTIRWHSSFRAKVPGMGGIYRRALTMVLQRCADGLARAAAAAHAP